MNRRKFHAKAANEGQRHLAYRPNDVWAMDFVSAPLLNGNRLRVLKFVDAMDCLQC
jgi:putative transposase